MCVNTTEVRDESRTLHREGEKRESEGERGSTLKKAASGPFFSNTLLVLPMAIITPCILGVIIVCPGSRNHIKKQNSTTGHETTTVLLVTRQVRASCNTSGEFTDGSSRASKGAPGTLGNNHDPEPHNTGAERPADRLCDGAFKECTYLLMHLRAIPGLIDVAFRFLSLTSTSSQPVSSN